MVPTGTGKNEKAFSSQGNLSRLQKSRNFTQNTGKNRENLYWKTEKILEKSASNCENSVNMVPYFK